MPRQRDPKRAEAFEIWKKHKGDITNRAIAEQLNVLEKTVSAWKSRDKWNAVLQTDECSTTNEAVSLKPRPLSDNKRKRSGNPDPPNQFTKRNKASETHGFFAKFLPEETLEIVEEFLIERSPADLIWDQIKIQYAAIMRSQKIMFVRDQDDMTREIRKESENATEWEIQYAWDKQATFLNAQSRAASTLQSLIKQFEDMAHSDDERRLKLEQMRLGIDKTKAEIDKLNGIDDEATINGLDQLAEAIQKSASAIKGDS